MTPREKLARVIAMARVNRLNSDARARLPILQEGERAKAPYFEIVRRSGVSLACASEAELDIADRILEHWPDIKDIVERE